MRLILPLLIFCLSMNSYAAISGKVTIRGKITDFDTETVTIRDYEGKTWTVKKSALSKNFDPSSISDRTVVIKVRSENAKWTKTR